MLSQKMESSTATSMTTSGLTSGSSGTFGDAPREARPTRFQVPSTEDCNLFAETPLVSASHFAASLENLAASTSGSSR